MMNIEKIKNYNQKMLAAVSTLLLLILAIWAISTIISDLPIFNKSNRYDAPSGLIADAQLETLNQENLRKQIVSYDSPWLIDTLRSVYVIPVSITTLRRPEESVMIDEGLFGLMNIYPSFSKGKRGYYSKSFEGSYANLIIYFPLENRSISLFNERMMIGNVQTFYFKDDILLVFHSAEKDTNKDGIIGLSDTNNLCIYSLKNETLKKISDGDHSVEQYQFIENSKDLLIKFSLSQYWEKEFSSHWKPSKIMRYGYDSQKLTDVIPQKIQAEMQKLVEGR